MKPKLYYKNEKGRYIEYKEPKREDCNVYYKNHKDQYIPMGIISSDKWTGDGLWLVRKQGKNMLNADHYAERWGITKVSDVPRTDMTKIGTAADIHEAIDKFLFKKYGYTIGNIPHQDLADEITNVLMNIEEHLKTEW